MKRLEVLDGINAQKAKATGQKYKSIFAGKEDCKWSYWKNFSGESLLKHVKDTVFPFIQNLNDGEDVLYSKYMKGATFMIQKATLLQEAISILDELNITARNEDVQGDIYEYLLSELQISGKNGQFRTPRHIIRMMVELVNPKLGETICDPACGTGGFLINAYEHIVKANTSPEMIRYDQDGTAHNLIGNKITKKEHWELLRNRTFFGFDFDYTMIRIGLMNMILHGIRKPNISYADSLSKSFDQKKQYDIILANPPFAGSIDKGDINDNFRLDTTKTELLFGELFYNVLKIGGRAAVIIPTGVLSGQTNVHKELRKMLVEKCQLEGIITMPSGIFKPYSGVPTAILIFIKGGETEDIWFYEMQSDGYTLDDRRAPIDEKGDISDIIDQFKKRKRSKNSFLIKTNDVVRNHYILSPTDYKQTPSTKTPVNNIGDIIKEISKIEEDISNTWNELKARLKQYE